MHVLVRAVHAVADAENRWYWICGTLGAGVCVSTTTDDDHVHIVYVSSSIRTPAAEVHKRVCTHCVLILRLSVHFWCADVVRVSACMSVSCSAVYVILWLILGSACEVCGLFLAQRVKCVAHSWLSA